MKSLGFLAAFMAAVIASPVRESAEIDKRKIIGDIGFDKFFFGPEVLDGPPELFWNPPIWSGPEVLDNPGFGENSGGKKRLVLDGPGFGDNLFGGLDGGSPFTEGITGNIPDLDDVNKFLSVIISLFFSILERFSGGQLIDGIQPLASRDLNLAPK